MFARCTSAIWDSDDFSRCFQHDYLQTRLPLIACAVSVLYLAYHLSRTAIQSRRRQRHEYKRIPNGVQHDGRAHEHEQEHEQLVGSDSGASTTAGGEDEERRNEELALELTKSHTDASFLQVNRPRGEVSLPVIEEIAVLAELGVQVAALILDAWGRDNVAAIAEVAVWAYIATLASLRLLFSSTSRLSFPQLWYHTAFLYCFQWLCAVLLFRSEIIHPRSHISEALMSTHVALTTILALIALTSRKGNRAVELEYEGNVEPSKEPLASVLSLATFGWVDTIVWRGYKAPLEMKDVWNLVPCDKAAAILADYRQLQKTSILAWHLLRYFRRDLIIQASWAAISGVVTFVPTLLLRVILEYIEEPSMTPKNAAWLYVILLFVSGCLNALSSGQALWIGRKICIRLRAIIIGEIYAKALRRRAAAAPDKVLGQQEKKKRSEDEPTQSALRRALTFGRRKHKKTRANGEPSNNKATEAGEEQVTSGTIINLMAVDSFKVSEISAYLHFLWAETPVQFFLAILLLYLFLGNSSIVGIGMMGLLLPVNMAIAKRFTSVQKKILAATDARIHTTNEVLTNVRIIKYFAWEQRFLGTVDEKREVELKHLRNRYIVWAIAATIWSGAPVVITFLTFLVYTLVEKKDLVPSVAFTALSLFSLLRIPLDQLADMVAHVQESKVSVDRVEEYLNEPETDKYKQLTSNEFDENGEPLIGFSNGTFSWGGRDSEDFKMIDLDIFFKVGQLNVVIGPTGSGKTSLLMALLGEMTLLGGSVYLPAGKSREEVKHDPGTGLTESVAYCAQQAWLMNGTIKENILFASKWDSNRYRSVIIACSLQRDLEILDAGDQTLVGEKGVTLSGGQKQRISLARALYCEARHVILDDVLSAVDSHTAKWIFDKALMGPLMYSRTCILVTHNSVLCLPHADFAVVLDNGRVVSQGTAEEVVQSGALAEDASKFDIRLRSAPASKLPSRVPSDVGGDTPLAEMPPESNGHANGHIERRNTEAGACDPLTHVLSKDLAGMNKPAEEQADLTESKSTGAIKLSIITMYLGHMGGWAYWILAAVCFAGQQLAQVATAVWIKQWSTAYERREFLATGIAQNHTYAVAHVRGGSSTCLQSGSCIWNLPFLTQSAHDLRNLNVLNSDVDVKYYLWVYAGLGTGYMAITLLRECVLFAGSLTASKRIHRDLMDRVTHAKFRFFDSTPLGQIMNRFSKDIEAVDQEIAPVAVGVVHCMFSVLTIVVLISVITPIFLLAAVFITILYYIIGMVYISSSRDLKRLESVQRSPLYQQFGETLSGMTTIRAYGDENRFIRENLHRVNTHSRPFIYLWAANRWLALRVDVVGALVSFSTGAFVVWSVGRVNAGAAGLAMTYAVQFTENVLWFVRLYASNEQNMNAVERVKEYLDVDQEAAPIVEDNRPEANWPSKGSVEFIGYSTRYRSDFDFVLKNVTFRILPGEKIGVVGRTGAGKSSLALALFRALEAEQGKILVDNVDIGLIGLQDLRENIVMVPQDPTLFTGTVRSNLDPFGLFTDEQIYTALRGVQLIGAASAPASAAPSTAPSRPQTPAPLSPLNKQLVSASTTAAPPTPSSATSPTTLENKNIFRNLNSAVAEHGSNLSQGQRQLLCLARALLKNPKVLLMDEATASIDYATDSKIQETIREIKNTTITIAHRLQTIIDYDKVLVLDKGEVIEYGDPFDLINKEKGIFRGMCEMTGDIDVLQHDAKKAHDAKKLIDDS